MALQREIALARQAFLDALNDLALIHADHLPSV
jgi:hypothetical protein